jgi:hypothetical protein
MAYAITSNSILQLTFDGQTLGQQILTVLNYKLRSPVSIADGAAALGRFLDVVQQTGRLQDTYGACMSTDYFFRSVTAQWILSTRHAYLRRLVTTNGTSGGDLLAPNAAFVIVKQTEVAGPKGHGLVHMGGVPVTFASSGSLSGTGAVAYAGLVTELIAPIVTAAPETYDPVLVNKVAIATSPIIIAGNVLPDVRTMHRRTVGLGS